MSEAELVKIGILSDAHGNDAALQRCVESLIQKGAEAFYFLGDAIGYMPNVNSVIKILQQINARCLCGNHEEMMLGRVALAREELEDVYRFNEAKKTLLKKYYHAIQKWELVCRIHVDGKKMLMVHGSPWDVTCGYIYPTSNLNNFSSLPFDFVFMGHTHYPFISSAGNVQIINVGSCGLPRDIGNMASCALFDTALGRCEILRIQFDVEGLIADFGDAIHADVKECLRR